MKAKSERSCNYCILLYPDEQAHCKALEYIKGNFENYAYILHDCDISSEGIAKKHHWHVVIHFKNQRYLHAVACELQIPTNYVQTCSSFGGAVRYLIHYDDEQKYQYPFESIQTNIKDIGRFFNSPVMCLEDFISIMLDFLEENSFNVSFVDCLNYACSIQCVDLYKKSYYMLRDIIYEYKKERAISHE